MELSEPLPFGVPIDTGVVLDLDKPNDAMPTVTVLVDGDWEDIETVGVMPDEPLPDVQGYTIRELMELYGPDAVVVPRVIYKKG